MLTDTLCDVNILDMATVLELPSMTDKVISATVKALYSGRGLTAEQVANAIRVSTGTMSSRLNGKTPWTAAEVHRLAELFAVTVTDLYEGIGGIFPGPTGGSDAKSGASLLPRRDSNTQPAGYIDRWTPLLTPLALAS